MKLPGVDVDKTVAAATAPFLARLDAMQVVLEAILRELQTRQESGLDEFAPETTHNPEESL